MKKLELEYLAKAYPDKKNVNPWNHSEQIQCKEIKDKYYECLQQEQSTGRAGNSSQKCSAFLRMASNCYKLNEKYFLDSANSDLMEDYYLDLYLKKQLRADEVLKPKNKF